MLFVEQNPKEKAVQGIPVIAFSQMKQTEYDAVLIAISVNRRLARLLEYLHDHIKLDVRLLGFQE